MMSRFNARLFAILGIIMISQSIIASDKKSWWHFDSWSKLLSANNLVRPTTCPENSVDAHQVAHNALQENEKNIPSQVADGRVAQADQETKSTMFMQCSEWAFPLSILAVSLSIAESMYSRSQLIKFRKEVKEKFNTALETMGEEFAKKYDAQERKIAWLEQKNLEFSLRHEQTFHILNDMAGESEQKEKEEKKEGEKSE